MPRCSKAARRKPAPPPCSRSREYWLDIGRMDDFNKANDDYVREFWTGEGAPS